MDRLHWFRRPTQERSGMLNPSYELLDHPIVSGRADEPALLEDEAAMSVSHAQLLEQVGCMGGVLRGFGAGPGARVLVDIPDPARAVVALLAAIRVGAVAVVVPAVIGAEDLAGVLQQADPLAAVTGRCTELATAVGTAGTGPAATVVDGEGALLEDRDVSWSIAMRAGRTDPAPAAGLPADAPCTAVWTQNAGLRNRDVEEVSWVLAAISAGAAPTPTALLRALCA